MLRFYVKREGEKYRVLGENRFLGKWVFTPQELFNIDAPFASVQMAIGFKPSNITGVEPLYVDEIKPEALKAAMDFNEASVTNKRETQAHRINLQYLRQNFQEVSDRTMVYGADFEADLNKLLEKYPLKVEYKDNFYRHVSK